jgi:hypothetical protein
VIVETGVRPGGVDLLFVIADHTAIAINHHDAHIFCTLTIMERLFSPCLDARPTAEQREDDTLPDRSDKVDDMMLDVSYRFLSAEGRLRTMTCAP